MYIHAYVHKQHYIYTIYIYMYTHIYIYISYNVKCFSMDTSVSLCVFSSRTYTKRHLYMQNSVPVPMQDISMLYVYFLYAWM